MDSEHDFSGKRLPVWRALSNLFLDTELGQADYQRIAGEIAASEFSRAEISEILWREVFPALADNLRIVAGEWDGFADDWLRERILAVRSGRQKGPGFWGLMSVGKTRELVADAWDEVQRRLPGDYP